jgi:hypothetical protein
MVMNGFGNRNFMQTTGRLSNAFKVPFFFLLSFGLGGGGGFFHFSFVPNMFPSGSQYVPNVFPKDVPNSTLL